MGSLFKSPKPHEVSTLSPAQRALLRPMADFFSTQIGRVPPEYHDIQRILAGDTNFLKSLVGPITQEAFLVPALRSFQTNVAPAINAQFASIGGTLSSRREKTLAEVGRDIQVQSQAQMAQMLPQLLGMQIGTTQELAKMRFLPTQQALAFALNQTQQGMQPTTPPGYGIFGSLLGAATALAMPPSGNTTIQLLAGRPYP